MLISRIQRRIGVQPGHVLVDEPHRQRDGALVQRIQLLSALGALRNSHLPAARMAVSTTQRLTGFEASSILCTKTMPVMA